MSVSPMPEKGSLDTATGPDPELVAAQTGTTRIARDRSFVRGVAWNGAVKAIAQTAAWSSTLVVARFLSPDDYGVVGMATFCIGLIEIVTEFGISAAIVAKQDLSDSEIEQLNSISVLMGILGMALLCLAAPAVAWFFKEPRVTAVLVVLSVTFLLKSLRSVPYGMLQRDLNFRSLAIYDGIQSLSLAALSVVLAVMGLGYWTLVAAAVASAIITATIAVVRHPVRFRKPEFRRLRHLLAFSGHIVGQRATWFGYSNSDFIVAGKMLGSGPLGSYTLAWTLSHLTDKVTYLILGVTPPILAKVQKQPEEMRRYVTRITEALAITVLPLTIGLALVAPELVPTVLGTQWTSMVFPLQVLSAYAGVGVIVPLLAQVLNATGHERYGMHHNFIQLAVMPIAFVTGAYLGGINGMVIAWITVHPFLAARISRYALRIIHLPVRDYFRDALAPSLVGCALMAVTVTLTRFLVAGLPPYGRLGVEIGVGAATYLGVLFALYRNRITGMQAFARQILGSR